MFALSERKCKCSENNPNGQIGDIPSDYGMASADLKKVKFLLTLEPAPKTACKIPACSPAKLTSDDCRL